MEPMSVSRFEAIVDVIGPRIANGEFNPGDALTLADIESEFNCSRTVAREVQRSLEEYGFVMAQRRLGLVVQPPEKWSVFNPRVIRWRLDGPHRDRQIRSLIDLRQAVEPIAAGLAAQYATRDQRDEILRIGSELVKLGETSSGGRFMDVDVEFHTRILEASGNEMFISLSDTIQTVLKWRFDEALMPPKPEPRAMKDHEMIARAIYSGDRETATEAMRDIVAEVQKAFDTNAPNILRFD